MTNHTSLLPYAWLSIVVAIITISLKTGAYFLTGSVSLLSDALESVVNLVAAVIALIVLMVASRPPDDDHTYGHSKAEYFSSAAEGILILIAALSIGWTAFGRLFDPQPLEAVGLGLTISVLAAFFNFVAARILLKVGKQHNSITLEADAHHLMTDVWTSGGVLVGIVLVVATGWLILDPIIALLVAANIVWTGVQLIRRSASGFMDSAIPKREVAQIEAILQSFAAQGVTYHALRTRQAASRHFASVHLLVPNEWSVQRGHAISEKIEADIRTALPNIVVFTHLEPQNDPLSFADMTFDRV